MEIKHQVFVSSTFKDLITERSAVIHALLELDCIPAGMELFPATDEDAWTLIKEVIDGCDYYLLIIAGKYGSVNKDGVSYTEMEFDYAASKGKPIMCFIHENIDSLPASSTEKTEDQQKRLLAFIDKAKSRHFKTWMSPDDLGGKVSRSLIQLKKRHPSPGWVPGTFAMSDEVIQEIHDLKIKIAELESERAFGYKPDSSNVDSLAQGNDPIDLSHTILNYDENGNKDIFLHSTWDKLLSYFGPSMINECTDEEMFMKVKLAYFHSVPKEYKGKIKYNDIVLQYVLEDRIRIQFQALGIIAPGSKRRAVKDTARYWRLTPHGQNYLINLKAERRTEKKDL